MAANPTVPIIGNWVNAQTSRHRKQQVKARAEQSELARAQLQLLHDRDCGDPNHRLVGEIDQHEEEQQSDDQPSLLRSPGAVGLGDPCGPRTLDTHEDLGAELVGT
jgi:hypothetical protein